MLDRRVQARPRMVARQVVTRLTTTDRPWENWNTLYENKCVRYLLHLISNDDDHGTHPTEYAPSSARHHLYLDQTWIGVLEECVIHSVHP